MAEGSVTYIYPSWGLIPPLRHKSHVVHAQVTFLDDSGAAPDIAHNFDLPYGGTLQPPDWIIPLVVVNPTSAGPNAPVHVLAIKDGNTISVQRSSAGVGKAVTYDVWIFRPKGEGFLSWL